MINDLDIVPMASGGPDLETLVRHGDAALNAHLETLENRLLGPGSPADRHARRAKSLDRRGA